MRMKTIDIMNYCDQKTTVELEDKDIVCIVIEVVTGDEIVNVLYRDGTKARLDPWGGTRVITYYDGKYVLYLELMDEINKSRMEKFEKRESSYDLMDIYKEGI